MAFKLFDEHDKRRKRKTSQLKSQKDRRKAYLQKCVNGKFDEFIIPDLAQFFRDMYYVKNGKVIPTSSITLTNLVFSELISSQGGPHEAMKMIAAAFSFDPDIGQVTWFRSQYNVSRLMKDFDIHIEDSRNLVNAWSLYVQQEWKEL